MVEAEQYPGDFDGVIAGDPALDLRLELSDIRVHKAYLDHPDGRLWGKDLSLVDKYVLNQCDDLDGVKDGVIQDPDKCHPDFSVLICRPGQTNNCLTTDRSTRFEHLRAPRLTNKAKRYIQVFLLDTTCRRGPSNGNSARTIYGLHRLIIHGQRERDHMNINLMTKL